MNRERIISAYKNYFKDFNSSLSDAEARKVFYVIEINKAIQLKKEYYAGKK